MAEQKTAAASAQVRTEDVTLLDQILDNISGSPEPGQRMPGGYSRWSAGKDLSWEPVRAVRVCEVKYDHMQGDRFRHAATFLRWREDKEPKDCTPRR